MHRMTSPARLLCAALVLPVSAGQRPDFSGTWGLPAGAPLAPNGRPAAASGFGPEITIHHDGNVVTVSRLTRAGTIHVRHTLDGVETHSRTRGRLCEADTGSIWSAAWDGASVVTSLLGSLPPGGTTPTKMNVRHTFRMEGPDRMALDVTFQNPGMAEPLTRTTVYVRTGPPGDVPAPAAAAPVQARISAIDWLGGTWIGSRDTLTFEERWTPPSGGSMLSIARTLRGGVMNGFEFLCIAERNGGLVYQAMPNGRQPATDFTLTKLDGTTAVFENPAHDFPKKIQYSLSLDGTLEAVISGTEKQKPQTFRFTRQP